MNTKDENTALGSFSSAANTVKWPPCPYGSPWFVISQLNCGSKVLRCLFRKAPGLQHGIHVGVCLGGGVWPKFFKGTVGSDRAAGWTPTHQRPGRPAREVALKEGGKKKKLDLHISSSALPLGALALHLGTRPAGETGDRDVEMKDRPDWFILWVYNRYSAHGKKLIRVCALPADLAL